MTENRPDETTLRWWRVLAAVAIAGFAQVLLYYAAIGTNARFFADDYCVASSLAGEGLVAAWVSTYFNWSGRFASYLLALLVQFGDMAIVPYLPATALLVWFVVAALSLLQLNRLTEIRLPGTAAVLLAGVLIYATIDGAADVIESLFWRTGMLTYLAPLILLTGYAGLLANRYRAGRRPRWGWLAASFALAFVGSGFSETYAVMQMCLLGLGILGCWAGGATPLRQRLLPLLLAGLVGALAGTVIVVAAPGNAVRQSFFAPPPDLATLLAMTLQVTRQFLGQTLAAPLPLLTALLMPAVVALLPHGRSVSAKIGLLLLMVLPVAALLVIVASLAPAVYGMSRLAPDRALITPYAALVALSMAWGYLGGRLLAHRWPRLRSGVLFKGIITGVVAALLLAGPVMSTVNLMSFAETAAAYADGWDQRDAYIRAEAAAGNLNLAVPRLPYLADLEADPKFWINICMAGTYGLESITAQ